MSESCANLKRFVSRVYWRLLVLRMAEAGGVGMAIGALSAIMLFFISDYGWGGVSLPVGVMMVSGAVVGGIWAILRRARPIEAAIEADRQLGLADLLSTAWVICGQGLGDKDLAAAVLAVAEDRCAGLGVSDVVLNRFGRRAWGGIGLVCALSLVLGFLSANPVESEAVARAAVTGPGIAGDERGRAGENSGRGATMRRNTVGVIGVDHPGGDEGGFDPSRNTKAVAEGSGRMGGGTEMANAEGTGTGAGRSQTAGRVEPLTSGGTNAARGSEGGVAAAGTGASMGNGNAGRGALGAAAGNESAGVHAAPAWRMAGWAAASEQAGAAMREGRVPAEYQDIVRKYFERE
ncbi:MAG: hypothetical protein NTU53_10145 [Planctomycetota bacterium]|nr:hypothetical protein [Planctomycetota bacterium]